MARGLLLLVLCFGWTGAALAAGEPRLEGGVNPGYHEPPEWFKPSFLDLGEDVADAADQGKRLMLYFYQDGCPYCAKLLEDNFGQRAIAEKTQRLYDVVAINMWGDREVIDPSGAATTEKAFAKAMRVMFTPTLLFLDGQGRTVFRINGYYHPRKFDAALDYAAGPADSGMAFRDFFDNGDAAPPAGKLHDQPFFMAPPYALARTAAAAQRPLLVLFEQTSCLACDELHGDVFQRESTRQLIDRFDVVRLDMRASTPVLTPAGRKTTATAWADELGVQYAPTLVFFDQRGAEVFRTEAYLRTFHMQSALEYVASGAYREEPEFQRFVQSRADRLREQGIEVDLWE